MYCIPAVLSYPVKGDNYFHKDGDAYEEGIIIIILLFSSLPFKKKKHKLM